MATAKKAAKKPAAKKPAAKKPAAKKPAAKKASTKAKTVKPVFQIITLADNGSDIVESEVRGDRVAALKAIAEAKAGSLSGAEVVISVTNGEAVSIFTYIGGKRVE